MRNFSALLLTIIALSACTTSKSAKESDLENVLKDSDAERQDESIVFQLGKARPVLANEKREYWLEIRESKGASRTRKILATLAASEFEAAEAEARDLLLKSPKNESALVILAISLSMQGKHALAEYYANLCAKYYPESSNAALLNIRGITAAADSKTKIQDLRLALKLFSEAFSSGSEIASGLNLGDLYLEMGNAKAAWATFSEVRSRCKNCIPAVMGEGIAYSRLREFASAKANFEAILKKQPNHSEALYRLALVEESGFQNSKGAKQCLQTLLSLEISGNQDQDIRQKAQIMLRKIEARATPERDIAAGKVDESLLETSHSE